MTIRGIVFLIGPFLIPTLSVFFVLEWLSSFRDAYPKVYYYQKTYTLKILM